MTQRLSTSPKNQTLILTGAVASLFGGVTLLYDGSAKTHSSFEKEQGQSQSTSDNAPLNLAALQLLPPQNTVPEAPPDVVAMTTLNIPEALPSTSGCGIDVRAMVQGADPFVVIVDREGDALSLGLQEHSSLDGLSITLKRIEASFVDFKWGRKTIRCAAP